MKPKKIEWVFAVAFKSCAPGGTKWCPRYKVCVENPKNTPVAVAGNLASQYLKVDELGVRIEYQGLKAEGSTEITPCNNFVLTVERSEFKS